MKFVAHVTESNSLVCSPDASFKIESKSLENCSHIKLQLMGIDVIFLVIVSLIVTLLYGQSRESYVDALDQTNLHVSKNNKNMCLKLMPVTRRCRATGNSCV
jgi:hypothetical protein